MSSETLQKLVDANVKLTPMMEQYYQIRKQYPDAMLLFRMGDFYEVFFEDAIEASRILNIARTHRGKLGDTPIPMAGIPHHAASNYIDRLTEAGLKVAVCEQIQDPKEAKGIVQRAVTQVVSPGMPFNLEQAHAQENHFMVAGLEHKGHYTLVAIDFTTGEFVGHRFNNFEDFLDQLRLYSPKEFITYMGQWDSEHYDRPEYKNLLDLIEYYGILKTHLSSEYFDPKFSQIHLERVIPSYKRDKLLNMHPEILAPVGALCYYICSTQNSESFIQIKPFRLVHRDGHLKVTLHTLKGLEIFPQSREGYRESLLGFMDKTQTAMGSRQLKAIFQRPLTDLSEIKLRQDCLENFLSEDFELELLRDELSDVRDLERILTKISTNKATPSDLINISVAIVKYQAIKKMLDKSQLAAVKKLKPKDEKALTELAKNISETINDEIGASLEKGNLIRPNVSKQRDKLARLAFSANEELSKLEIKYREETGIQKLRVKSNNLAGYFIEVSKIHSEKMPRRFERRQTLVNSERYISEELGQLEKEMISAKEKLEKLEREIFKDILGQVSYNASAIQDLAVFMSKTDVFQSLAWVAKQESFTRPTLTDNSKKRHLKLEGLWHPLIKAAIKDQFVSHDLNLDSSRYFGLITGPNMAGKTTVMREVAITQLLAQVGSFVPATNASLGVCDYLFSRLGASDDILKGQSTFMVEMSETAEIIRHATERSLVILDEVGRGTSTYDGLSIAWALVEHLVEKTKALTLFATHYHELIDLIENYKQAKNLTVETQNEGDDIHFLYRLVERPASQSFGIYVAKLAGLPESILSRSQNILDSLEAQAGGADIPEVPQAPQIGQSQQLSFFAPATCDTEEEGTPDYLKQLEGDLKKLNVMEMTPIQALQKLQDLKDNLPLQ